LLCSKCLHCSTDVFENSLNKLIKLVDEDDLARVRAVARGFVDSLRYEVRRIHEFKARPVLSVTPLPGRADVCGSSVCDEPAEFQLHSDVGHWSGQDLLCERHTWGLMFGLTQFELDCVTDAWIEEMEDGSVNPDTSVQ
jgi:hypothetical protein